MEAGEILEQPKVLHKYNTKEIERVGVYLNIKWKEITKIKD